MTTAAESYIREATPEAPLAGFRIEEDGFYTLELEILAPSWALRDVDERPDRTIEYAGREVTIERWRVTAATKEARLELEVRTLAQKAGGGMPRTSVGVAALVAVVLVVLGVSFVAREVRLLYRGEPGPEDDYPGPGWPKFGAGFTLGALGTVAVIVGLLIWLRPRGAPIPGPV